MKTQCPKPLALPRYIRYGDGEEQAGLVLQAAVRRLLGGAAEPRDTKPAPPWLALRIGAAILVDGFSHTNLFDALATLDKKCLRKELSRDSTAARCVPLMCVSPRSGPTRRMLRMERKERMRAWRQRLRNARRMRETHQYTAPMPSVSTYFDDRGGRTSGERGVVALMPAWRGSRRRGKLWGERGGGMSLS